MKQVQKQPHKGIYTDLLSKALRNHFHGLALRSENHGSYLDFFVDNKQLGLIRTSDWQIIFGRR